MIVRVCGVLDSDRPAPGLVTSAHQIAEHLRGLGVRVLVLAYREAENYIPPASLVPPGADEGRRRTADALACLTPDQRGHYDMKRGFSTRAGAVTVRPDQRKLFADVDRQTMDALAAGFGEHILNCLGDRRVRLTVSDFEGLGLNRSRGWRGSAG